MYNELILKLNVTLNGILFHNNISSDRQEEREIFILDYITFFIKYIIQTYIHLIVGQFATPLDCVAIDEFSGGRGLKSRFKILGT